MHRRAAFTFKSRLRQIHTSSLLRQQPRYASRAIIVSSVVISGALIWRSNREIIHNDSEWPGPSQTPTKVTRDSDIKDSEALQSIVWGSNQSKTLLLDREEPDSIRTPAIAEWLEGVALRDLVLHKDHAACVDARGDVYQWGAGHFGSVEHDSPAPTLRNKNIVQLQLTESKLYALSASGQIYVMEASASKQSLPAGSSTPSSYPLWSMGWLWGKEEEAVDFVEIKPQQQLKRHELFVSISAGNDHLLALTSSGRAFAHPVNCNANVYGQLGFRKIEVPDPGHPFGHSVLPVQLIPKPLSGEAWKDNDTIRFCPTIYEIPSLRDIPVSQVAAGGRNSFIRTTTGYILGWGANEYGQIGLGGSVTVPAVTVPTEVIPWRMSHQTHSKCVDISAGGDLTCFKVEYPEEGKADIFMCGNGQWGGLGNNLFSNAQGTPVRAKNVGNLSEYSDATQSIVPIIPRSVSVSQTGHVLLTLDTSDGGRAGCDLLAWGKNQDSELGNGKKSSVPVPTTIQMGDERAILRKRKGVKVTDLKGQLWSRKAEVEQTAVAGYNNSVVYWKIRQL
ncbi:regulator of chromosome condensation 1/beta-lactamase-inhibitor protein II [Desarmillaria tabescens]|uniref:Regulator of chromosome condensation 1/beta-lactamase-inhibitor protein II n=1 Tax=Armillaria tabescens TaxID=1929756 RepID=A0AA39KIC7_ARMTA|nr:regulator of chromosome condensation 1/beta-lactamase-inhibitor protein II [Desarmillaria tabescens]KAK0459583.1 regulator of chromosome condensation 1/beta-lactamase-inhibitor protein II [Desarmillaria tabescens]